MTAPNTDRERLRAANAEAHHFYREHLIASPAAHGPCHYLTQRRLSHVLTAESPWPVGYAPASWTNLTDHLTGVGFRAEELVAAGLASPTRRGGIVDRFRDRIMLAQRDERGAVVGFVGRAAPGAASDAPKYLNTPGTDIYHKGDLLFGLYENRDALGAGLRPVLVEGPFDVLAVAAIDFGSPRPAAVAPGGTALTAEQVTRLSHHLPDGATVVTAYDNDIAGLRATAAAYELLTHCPSICHEHLAAAALPRGTDPAEVLQVHGAHALHTALTDPGLLTPLGQRAIDAELTTWAHVLDGAEGRIAAVRAVAPLIARLPKSHVATQVSRLAERVSLDPTTVTIALADALAGASRAHRRRVTARSDLRGPLPRPPEHASRGSPCRHVL